MVKQAGESIYQVWLDDEVHESRKNLLGKIRQNIKKLIDGLAKQPRPSKSKILDVTGLAISPQIEKRRQRLEDWRIIYAINDSEKWVWILAVRQRPPYSYEDLPELTSRLSE